MRLLRALRSAEASCCLRRPGEATRESHKILMQQVLPSRFFHARAPNMSREEVCYLPGCSLRYRLVIERSLARNPISAMLRWRCTMTQATISFQPREIVVRPGQSVKLRLLQPEDAPTLLRFFQRIPGHDRFYLKDDVTSSRVIEDWCANIDLKRVIPLVAEIEGEIVADGTLHRRRHPARRHIGEIRFVVDPRYRGRGLGTHLIYQLLELAYSNQMEKIVF